MLLVHFDRFFIYDPRYLLRSVETVRIRILYVSISFNLFTNQKLCVEQATHFGCRL